MGHADLATTQKYLAYKPRRDAARRLSAAFRTDVSSEVPLLTDQTFPAAHAAARMGSCQLLPSREEYGNDEVYSWFSSIALAKGVFERTPPPGDGTRK
jgi:hypothetical protein